MKYWKSFMEYCKILHKRFFYKVLKKNCLVHIFFFGMLFPYSGFWVSWNTTRGKGNHLCSIGIITRGLRPLVITFTTCGISWYSKSAIWESPITIKCRYIVHYFGLIMTTLHTYLLESIRCDFYEYNNLCDVEKKLHYTEVYAHCLICLVIK